jgi:aminoglycoside 6'-N-acetyltransferase I
MFVALAGDEVVGQCMAVIHRHPDKPAELYIDEVGVAPAYRRQGIARRLLDAMFVFGRSAGCREAWVGTEIDNVPARGLYRQRKPRAEETFVLYEYDL